MSGNEDGSAWPSGEVPDSYEVLSCGCRRDPKLGITVRACNRHDQRTREVKASAALQQMANQLDEAGLVSRGLEAPHLRQAARYAVKAAKALIGSDTE